MTRVPLTPRAGMIDSFAPAEVRGTVGSKLAGVAESLSTFNKNLQIYADVEIASRRHAGQEAALAEYAKRQDKSIADMEAAVRRGDIKEDGNPWKMVFLRKLVARGEVRNGLLGIEAEFESSKDADVAGLRQAQSIDQLDQWASSRVSKMVAGMDQATTASVAGVVDEWKSQFYGSVQNRWERDRRLATEIGFRQEISQAVGRAGPDWAAIQETINSASSVMVTPGVVERNVLNAITAVAIASRSPEIIEDAVKNLTIRGKPFADAMDAGDMLTARDAVDRAVASYYVGVRQQERAEAEAVEQAFMQKISDEARAAAAAGKPFDPLSMYADLSTFPADQQVKFKNIMDALASDDMNRYALGMIEGTDPTSPRMLSIASAIVASGIPGAKEAAATVRDIHNFAVGGQHPSDSDIDAYAEAIQLRDSTAPMAERVLTLTRLAPRLSRTDYKEAMTGLMNVGRVDQARASLVLQEKTEQLTANLEAIYFSSSEYAAASQLSPSGPPAVPPAVRSRIDAAAKSLNSVYTQVFSDNERPTLDMLIDALDKASARVLAPQEVATKIDDHNRTFVRVVQNPERAINDGLVRWSPPDKPGSDGKLEVSSGGRTTALPRMGLFTSSADFANRADQMVGSLGIQDETARLQFFEEQILRLPSSDDRERATQWVQANRWGDGVADAARATQRDIMARLQQIGDLQLAMGGNSPDITTQRERGDDGIWREHRMVRVPWYMAQAGGVKSPRFKTTTLPTGTKVRAPVYMPIEEARTHAAAITAYYNQLLNASSRLKTFLPNGEEDINAARRLLTGESVGTE